jgi:hypothetical protein
MSLRRFLTASLLALLPALVASADTQRAPAQAQVSESPCDITTTERVVAIGDVHGAYPQFVRILRAAGLIDKGDRWAGGRARLVQTGDVLDRGADSRRVLDLLRRLETQAARDGGRVHSLLGNHEFMRLVGDWRYVSPGELKAFQTPDSEDLRDRVHTFYAEQEARRARQEKRDFDERGYRAQFMKDFPLGHFDMQLAFGKDGEYGKWIRSRVAAVKINGVLFMHGGVSDTVANLGCEGLNAEIQRNLAAAPVPPDKLMSLLASTEDGPLWYRGMASEPEEAFEPMLESILKRMNARAAVIGHTPVPNARITTRFGGRVVMIDTGMLNAEFYPGGVPSALEMQGHTLTAIYEGRREPLTAPALKTE